MNWTKEQVQKRIVRYDDLIPCKNAFVDTRTPGSDQKENFTIIGPGVSENPNQYVHIALKHGFNIGGARQPPGCLNSQHSHDTAEVFIVHSGKWKMLFGVNADEGNIEMYPGDIISIPTQMFRGFENIGTNKGFLFAILGRNNPGKVTWAPKVFELAKKYGLILLKNGYIIDTTIGQTVPEGEVVEKPPNIDKIKQLETPSEEKLAKCIVKQVDLKPNILSQLNSNGVQEYPIISFKAQQDGFDNVDTAPIKPWWEHTFNLRMISLQTNSESPWYQRSVPEVIFVHRGSVILKWINQNQLEQICLFKGDTISIPPNLKRQWVNSSNNLSQCYRVLGL